MCCGLAEIHQAYDINLDFDEMSSHYEGARAMLASPCREDVLQRILLNGYPLIFNDFYGDTTHKVFLKDVYERMPNTPLINLANITNGVDDAVDAACVLQTILFNDVIYG